MAEQIPENVSDALAIAFQSDTDAHVRVLFFLADSEERVAARYITTLKSAVNYPAVFKKLAEQMAENTKKTAEQHTPVEQQTPAEQRTPVKQQTPVELQTPVEQQTPVQQTPVQQETPQNVLDALEKAFQSDADGHARVIYFLADSGARGVAGPYIKSLKSVVNNPAVFGKVADQIADATKSADEDTQYRQFMHDVRENSQIDELSEHSDDIGMSLAKIALSNDPLIYGSDAIRAVTMYNFTRSLIRLSPQSCRAIAQVVVRYAAFESVGPITHTTVAVYKASVSALVSTESVLPLVGAALLMTHLAYNVLTNIRRWYKREITGKRAVKNIMDNGFATAAGFVCGTMGGEMVGAAIGGAVAGPVGFAVGTVVGTVAGGITATIIASALSDKLTQWLFGLPQSEAVENAYNFMGVSQTASNDHINHCYRRLALRYHPDKNGDQDKWTQLQYSLEVIRLARGESC